MFDTEVVPTIVLVIFISGFIISAIMRAPNFFPITREMWRKDRTFMAIIVIIGWLILAAAWPIILMFKSITASDTKTVQGRLYG